MFLMNDLTIYLDLILLLIKSYNTYNSFEDKNNLSFLKKFVILNIMRYFLFQSIIIIVIMI